MKELTLQELALHADCDCEYEQKCYDSSWVVFRNPVHRVILTWLKEGDIRNIRPILRPLSDMTEEEANEFLGVDRAGIAAAFHVPGGELVKLAIKTKGFTATEMLWLARHGFDVLGLLDDGRAWRKEKQEVRA